MPEPEWIEQQRVAAVQRVNNFIRRELSSTELTPDELVRLRFVKYLVETGRLNNGT